MTYRYIKDLTSDVMFEAKGKTLNELFESAALATFEVICKIGKVHPKKQIEIEIKSNNLENLLFEWIQHLIALVDIEEIFFSKFRVIEITNNHLKAIAYGEEISPEKGNTVVKSVTNYRFSLKKQKEKYIATMTLDI